MSRKKSKAPAHTGRTSKGNTRDVKIERIGGVTILKRGPTYYLYYREHGQTRKPKIEGNLGVARATAAKVAAALAEDRPSPVSFQRTSPTELVAQYLDFAETVQCLAWRTLDRYRAALSHLSDFCNEAGLTKIDAVSVATVEDFVRWLRGQTRTRNGHRNGKRRQYKLTGIKFILGTCKTAFNWAYRRRMLPPYASNPFSDFKSNGLKDSEAGDEVERIFTPRQQQDFFTACTEWQRGLFLPLALLGMRAGELTHLLISDVDLDFGIIHIRSKPEMLWRVKTRRRRDLPLVGELRDLFEKLIGGRKSGFVLLNQEFATGERRPARRFNSDSELRQHLAKLLDKYRDEHPSAPERELRKQAVKFCRTIGQVPVKRLRMEFCDLTAAIGCPEFTRVHDLRHLFTSRAQEAGANPLLVQQILGHSTLDMTRRYTHLDVEAMRRAIEQLSGMPQATPESQGIDGDIRPSQSE